jgi:hypothetical protein
MLSKFPHLPLLILVLLGLFPGLAFAQSPKPAAEYNSLLNMRFTQANGEFVIEGLQVVFPAKGNEPATLTVNKSSGEELFSVPLRFESSLSSPLFGNFVPVEQASIKLGQSGNFLFTIKIADHAITRFPFSLKSEPEQDPYDPPKNFFRDGPWRDLAYFSVVTEDKNSVLDFNWWMSLRELPIGMSNPEISIHLLLGQREIARSRDRLVLSCVDWQSATSHLMQTTKSGTQPLTLRELTRRDGDYMLIVKANGTPVKSFLTAVVGGRLQRPEASRLDFEPHDDFMSPRFIDTTAKVGSRFLMRDVYWVKRSGAAAVRAQEWVSR